MLNEILADFWHVYRARVLCTLLGLFIGSMFIWLGFFKALFLVFCLGVGFYLGYKLDKNEDLLEWLDRLLPPGYHR